MPQSEMNVNELRTTMEIWKWHNVKYPHKIRVEEATAVIKNFTSGKSVLQGRFEF
jgi:TATA-box binding protein (TBP) (component of TFIID and TFIIIB)